MPFFTPPGNELPGYFQVSLWDKKMPALKIFIFRKPRSQSPLPHPVSVANALCP